MVIEPKHDYNAPRLQNLELLVEDISESVDYALRQQLNLSRDLLVQTLCPTSFND